MPYARRPSRRLQSVLPPAALFVLTLLVFAPVVGHPLLKWDDGIFIAQNPAYNPPTLKSLVAYWTEVRPSTQFYVPVMQSIWWVLAAVGGRHGPDGAWELPAAPFHAANWLAHATAAVLAYGLIRRMVRSRASAWVGAAVFAFHPVQVEAVAWASTFYTSLSTAFALAALLLLARYFELRFDNDEPGSDRSRRRRAWGALAAGTLCFAAGLLSKPAVVLAPVIAVALEMGIRRRPSRHVVGPVAAWMLLSVPVMFVAKLAQPPTFPYWPLWQRPFLAADALTFYLSKILLPIHLATDYGRSPDWLARSGAWHYTWVAPSLVGAGLLFFAVRRRTLWPLSCGAAFLAAALPTLGLSPFQYQEHSTVADRYIYFAMFAVGLAGAGALTLPRTPRGRAAAYTGAGCLLMIFAVTSHLQTYRWSDTVTLFRHTLEVNPDSLVANMLVADSENAAGNRQAAFEHLSRMIDAHPDSRLAQVTFAEFLYRNGRYEDAVVYYEKANDRSRSPNAMLLSNLGAALAQCDRQADAAAALERAITVDPNYLDARLTLAVVRAKLGQWEAARAQFQDALRISPNSAPALEGLTQLKEMGH